MVVLDHIIDFDSFHKTTNYKNYNNYKRQIDFYIHFRKWCDDVNLTKGFRYEITVYYYGAGNAQDYFKLGVKFPDSTEVKPVNSTYLRRSMGVC